MMNIKTIRNDVIKMNYCDYYTQMSYRDFCEFVEQNDENAQYEISKSQHETN